MFASVVDCVEEIIHCLFISAEKVCVHIYLFYLYHAKYLDQKGGNVIFSTSETCHAKNAAETDF